MHLDYLVCPLVLAFQLDLVVLFLQVDQMDYFQDVVLQVLVVAKSVNQMDYFQDVVLRVLVVVLLEFVVSLVFQKFLQQELQLVQLFLVELLF